MDYLLTTVLRELYTELDRVEEAQRRLQHAHDTMACIPERVYDEDPRLVCVKNQIAIVLYGLSGEDDE